jgi:hypothetical protein
MASRRFPQFRPAAEAGHHLVLEKGAVRRLARKVARGLQGHGALPVVRRGEEEHVQVVRRVDRYRAAFARLQVGHARLLVATDRVAPAADVHQHVRRHVRHVAHPRDRVLQQFRTRHRPPRIARRFHRVDVQVAGAGVGDVAGENVLQRRQHGGRPRLRLAVRGPVVPRTQHHQRLAMERAGVEVVRETTHHVVHGARVRAVQPRPVRFGRHPRVAASHRVDQRPLHRARTPLQPPRLLDRLERLYQRGGIAPRVVDVRAGRPRHAPPAHRAFRVEARRFPERAHRLAVREAEGEAHPLVEMPLRQRRRGRDRAHELAQVLVERHILRDRGGGRRVLPVLSSQRSGEQGREQRGNAVGSDRRHGGRSGEGWITASKADRQPAARLHHDQWI